MTPQEHEEVLLLQVFDEFDAALASAKGSAIKWILAKAEADAVNAMRQLIDVSPDNPKAIMALQNEVQRNRDLTAWLNEAVNRGHEIYARLNESQQAFVGEFVQDGESGDEVMDE
jgi:hypothetical protein